MEFFKGRKIAIATKHEKEKVMGTFLSELGLEYFVPKNFDTDKFGTFTREVTRSGNQLEAARKKAIEAMNYSGVDIAISSEGSFGQDPEISFVPSNLELVLFVDKKYGIEVRGHARTHDTNFAYSYVSSLEEALSFAKKVGFPEHGVIVRKHQKSKEMYKDISSWSEFEKIVTHFLARPFVRKVFLETDMRAHRNPTRMKNIESAMADLVKNIKSLCPSCGVFGYSSIDTIPGLRCRLCKHPTDLSRALVYHCFGCDRTEEKQGDIDFAEPVYCQYCNP